MPYMQLITSEFLVTFINDACFLVVSFFIPAVKYGFYNSVVQEILLLFCICERICHIVFELYQGRIHLVDIVGHVFGYCSVIRFKRGGLPQIVDYLQFSLCKGMGGV